MDPSSPSSRRGSRGGSVKYAHSPYVYRTTVDEAPVSPMSDQGRQELGGVPTYHSPRSLSQSTGNIESSSLCGANNNGWSQPDFHSQPSSPLGRSTTGQEYSQPIQVGSAPNVHPRYRRGMQSPMTRGGNESGGRGGFPSSPSGSLPPRSPFMPRDESTSAFSGGESAPVRGSNNPYRISSGTGLSAPQYSVPLSGSRRSGNYISTAGGGTGSGSQSPAPPHARQLSGSGAGNSALSGAPPTSPPNMAAGLAPAYHNTNSYAPTSFSMPPAMATVGSVGGGGSFRGSHSGSYVDPRSNHRNTSSPLLASNGRPLIGTSAYVRGGEPISPTHTFSSGSYGGAAVAEGLSYSPNHHNSQGSINSTAPPPTFASALHQAQQQQQQQNAGGFAVGSFPGRRAVLPGHPSSPFSNHMQMTVSSSSDPAQMNESYGTNARTLSTMADDTVSSSGKSGSSASSIRDDLPLCPNDDACTSINDRKHQKKYAHTCRLFPCYHGHVARHAKLFRHAPGQISLPEGLTAGTKVSSHALASVNFDTIKPDAPNAYRIYVAHGDKSYEIFGDWASVKVHTFKRYLHQVYHIPPGSQILSVMKTGKVMDDDINTVKRYGIEEDSVIQLRSDIEDAPAPGKFRIPLDDL
jgi:hypothetical protein